MKILPEFVRIFYPDCQPEKVRLDEHGKAAALRLGNDFVLPIMAACLLGRAFSSVVCKTPIYRAFAQRLLEERKVQVATSGNST
jgi:hypothetical protein